MMKATMKFAVASIAIASIAGLHFAAMAADDSYPSRPVRLIVAQAAGGGPDVLARVIATELSTQWKQAVIVENKLGAAGAIAAEYVAKSPADGYTLFVASAGIMAIAPAMDNKLPYTQGEFAPVVHLGSLSNVFVVSAQSNVKTIQGLVDAAKAAPQGLSVASMGPGSTGQIASEMLVRSTGIKTVEVAYKGESLAVTDLRGGHFDFMAAGMPVVLQQIKAGALTPLAVSGSKRSAALPNVPTMAESGFKDYEVAQWYALYAPINTPPDIVAKVMAATRVALAKPNVQKQIAEMGMELTNDKQRDFAAFDKSEKQKWGEFIKAGSVK